MENERALADVLDECLEAIETEHASVEDCLARYPQYASVLVDLLRLSESARELPVPAPAPGALAAGEQRLIEAARLQAAQGQEGQKQAALLDVAKAKRAAWPRWVVPAAVFSTGMAALFLCVVLVLIGGGLAWRGLQGDDMTPGSLPTVISKSDGNIAPLPSPTGQGTALSPSPLPSPTAVAGQEDAEPTYSVVLPLIHVPLPPDLAMLERIEGVVEVQGSDGAWSAAYSSQTIPAGTRMRTGALSGADVMFYDGSRAYLGPNTEISIDTLGQDPEDHSRIVELSQWVGETDHDVAPSYGARGHYQVHTPSGTGEAKGTVFHVSVTPALVMHLSVDQGAVEVTHLDVTVVVVAGQLTTVQAGSPPAKPVFRVTGEGEVEAIGSTWQIAGQRFQTHQATVIVGNPQVGDWVSVDGHLVADGAQMADRIVLLRRAPANRFTMTGTVQAMGVVTWMVAGQDIAVDEATEIDAGIQVGDQVRVEGVIDGPGGGMLLAETIERIDERGMPFSFVGIVQELAEIYWVVSGISITVDAETAIDSGVVVSDIVRVRGEFLEAQGGTWLARSIAPVAPEGARFGLTGRVEAIGAITWTVSGQVIVVNEETEIGADIRVGDGVRVQGTIDQDGVLRARSIHLVEASGFSFAFVGTVQEIAAEQWLISGISVTVDAGTAIDDDLAAGDLVRVRGRMTADGRWLAHSIRKLLPEELEFEFVGVVEGIDPWIVSGRAIETRVWTEIRGEIEIGDRVKVKGRILPDGTWLADEIKLADDRDGLYFEFVGRVERIDPWVVSGVELEVNQQTEIRDQIEVGDRVKVEGRILTGGELLATEIKLADERLGPGCIQFAALVVRVTASQVVLQSGDAIPLGGAVVIEGTVQPDSVILFYLCVDVEGHVSVVRIVVLYQIEPVIIVQPTPVPTTQPAPLPTQPAPPPSSGSIVVSDNNQTQTFTCSGQSVTINGNDNTITLLGSCGPVTVRGNNNWVSIQSAASVTNTGNNNTIVGR